MSEDSVKTKCSCGSEVLPKNMKQHVQTKKHLAICPAPIPTGVPDPPESLADRIREEEGEEGEEDDFEALFECLELLVVKIDKIEKKVDTLVARA